MNLKPHYVFATIITLSLGWYLYLKIGFVSGISCQRNPTISQFIGYSTALQQFRAEYGAYPALFKTKERVNISQGENSELFIAALSGKDSQGQQERVIAQGNKLEIPFYTFGQYDLIAPKHPTDYWKVVDQSGDNIVVHVDHDHDGYVTIPHKGSWIKVREPVVIYSIDADGNPTIYSVDLP